VEHIDLLRAGTPFMDVRAPAEVVRGAMPGAANLPLLTDTERTRVGITFRQQGHDAAVQVGHRLVSGAIREERVSAWKAFAAVHPNAWIYCWRGGERSAIVQQWLAAEGVHLRRVAGGFKALRHICMAALAQAAAEPRPWLVLSGRTGSGKTELLRALAQTIDLEGLAGHRGSAFGALEQIQPAPVTFENSLAVKWLQCSGRALVLEDESRTIGRLALPETWHIRMQTAPVVLLTTPFADRCANIVREYVSEPLARGVGRDTLYTRYSDALRRIERRLGGLRRTAVQSALDEGFRDDVHERWVSLLLEWYYDPMYDHQLEAREARVIFAGTRDEIGSYLQTRI
jgi:tRNA 2-selenouridine synthase